MSAEESGAARLNPAASAHRLRSRPLMYLMTLGTVTFWGASFPLTKVALEATGPTAIAFLRWAISAILLVGWSVHQERKAPTLRLGAMRELLATQWRTVAWVAAIGITLFYWIENLAIRYTTATNAGVLANLTSVFIVLIGSWLLREHLTGIEWLAVLAAFAGSVLVAQGAGHLTLGGPGLIGDGLMIFAALCGAIYSIGGKGLSERFPATAVTAAVAAVGAILLLPLALIEGLHFDLPLATWGMIVLLGIGSGALANLWWLSLLASTTASRAAMALFLVPLIAAGISVTLLHEPVTPLLLVGSLLVLAGVIAVQRRS